MSSCFAKAKINCNQCVYITSMDKRIMPVCEGNELDSHLGNQNYFLRPVRSRTKLNIVANN